MYTRSRAQLLKQTDKEMKGGGENGGVFSLTSICSYADDFKGAISSGNKALISLTHLEIRL